jgi:aerobic-type carbon monoxide dehydrogenase small subunit (CoxS/CutS family)
MKKSQKQLISLKINGQEYELAIHPNRTLLEVLREDLTLTGTKEGCDDGVCGTCTVLLNGAPIRSCLYLAIEAQGKEVTTIEGLAEGERLHPIQQAFIEHGAIQCGYCSPGMILTAKALLDKNPTPTEQDIKLAIAGNFCRCTGYNKIVTAIKAGCQNAEEVNNHG